MFYKNNTHLVDEKWVAIDDREYLFPANTPLILCDPENGFDEAAAEKLIKIVTE